MRLSSSASTFRFVLSAVVAAMLALGLVACGDSAATKRTAGRSGGGASATAPKRGGSLTALVDKRGPGNWTSGLDPATNTIGYSTELQAIYGGLLLLRADDDGSNPRVVPNQAERVTLSSDLMTLTIKLRAGMTFSDGTPFDAKAVIWNFERDVDPKVAGQVPQWTVRKTNPFTSPDPLTVVIHLAAPDAAVVNGFPLDNTNWIASPTAFKKMGEREFRVKPVGAGPFVVVSDRLSERLTLKRNPRFFKADQGLPYLDELTFQSISGNDQGAYQALLAGNADTYVGMSYAPLIKQAQSNSKVTVTIEPASQPDAVQFNALAPPFDNKKAREAIYYATNWEAINKGLFNGNGLVTQSFTTPVDLFYHQKVPGYRSYDPAKAKKLVSSLGGLRFEMFSSDTPAYRGIMTALQTQWRQVGMHVEIKAQELALSLKQWKSGKWQAALVHVGDFDPTTGLGLALRFSSGSPYTGVKDPQLDALMRQGKMTADKAERDRVYQRIGKYMSDHAYALFGLAIGTANVVRAGVHGPGLTTKIPGGLHLTPIWTEAWQA